MAVVAANASPIIESARAAQQEGLATPVLVGDVELMRRLAREAGWDLDGVRLVAAANEREAAEIAVALARGGEVASLMKGHLHTDVLMRAVLDKQAGLRAGRRRITHVFHMSVPTSARELLISDAAVNVRPDLDTQIDIVRNAVDLGHAIGWSRPKVALLSATEEASEKVPSSVQAHAVVERLTPESHGSYEISGPLAFDNAVSPRAAILKNLTHPVAGQADILIVPNLDCGNALVKMMVYFMSATAAGIVLGAKVPIALTSRADPPEARVAAAALVRLMADAPDPAEQD